MPHSLFLGSALATQDRVSRQPQELRLETQSDVSPGSWHVPRFRLRDVFYSAAGFLRSQFRISQVEEHQNGCSKHSDHENNSLKFIKAHLYHGITDMVISLLGLAVVINSLYAAFMFCIPDVPSHFICRILILASAVFYYGFNQNGSETPASLFDAYDLLRTMLGKRK